MTLSTYHQKYVDQSDEELQRKADSKEQELASIFQEVSLNTDSDPVRLAVLGCGDKRFVALHKRIFEQVLKRNIEVTTFDITIDHLAGVSIHVFDEEEIKATSPKLPHDLWAVPLEKWKQKLTELGIEYMEIPLKYGP